MIKKYQARHIDRILRKADSVCLTSGVSWVIGEPAQALLWLTPTQADSFVILESRSSLCTDQDMVLPVFSPAFGSKDPVSSVAWRTFPHPDACPIRSQPLLP